jgi:phosphatidyl-myo-inositol alpha-mannosyltransferase
VTEVLPNPLRSSAPVSARPDGARTLTIGLVCPYSLSVPGGVQNHVLGLAGYLSGIGDQVRILAPGDLEPARARQYGLDPAQITSAGPALPVPYNGSIARVSLGPAVPARVRRWLATHRPDLLHIHEPLAPGASLYSLAAARTPVVATFHTATPRSRLLRLAGFALGPVIDKINAGVAVSEPARRVVITHLDRNPAIIPNGFRATDFDHDPPGQRIGSWRGGDHPRLVFLGRLDEPRKGLQVLLDALPMIKRLRPDLEVVIAGQGNLTKINKLLGDRRLPSGCLLVGQPDDDTRTRLLRSADLFVAPHIDRESFGIVLIEAITAGASVIASDLPAFIDLLGAGTDPEPLGFIFPAGDATALADAVGRALATDRTRLNARAQATVRRYDWSTVGPVIRSLYAGLAAGPTR